MAGHDGGGMRILHVHCRYREAGGEDAAVDAERRLLRMSGFQVIEHTATNPNTLLASAGRALLSPWNPAAFLELRRLARSSGADVAHVHNTWFSLSPSILEALHGTGIPVVMTLHNFRLACVNGLLYRDGRPCTDCVGRGTWQGVLHRCYRSSALASATVAGATTINRALGTWQRCVDKFLVLNDLAHDVLVRSGIPAAKVARTANFVADPGPREHPPSTSHTIVYVGRLSHEKGIDILLQAWRAWRPPQRWSLVIAGEGPLRARVEALADERVQFLGQVPSDRVAHLLRESRALIIPSLVFEGQPMVALEAFAAGLPVLGRGIGGTLEVLRPLGDAWMVPDATPVAWTRALDRLRDDDATDRAGRMARSTYEQIYSRTAAVHRAHSLYTGLCSNVTEIAAS